MRQVADNDARRSGVPGVYFHSWLLVGDHMTAAAPFDTPDNRCIEIAIVKFVG